MRNLTPDEVVVFELIQEVKDDPRTEGHGELRIKITDQKCVFVKVERDVKIQAK